MIKKSTIFSLALAAMSLSLGATAFAQYDPATGLPLSQTQMQSPYGYPSTGQQYTGPIPAYGSYGPNVASLQIFLQSRGFLIMPYGTAYGFYGPLTQAAYARYQASIGYQSGSGNSYGGQPTCPIGYFLTTHNGALACASNNSGSNNGNSNNNNGTLQGNDASLDNFRVEDGDDTDLEEGDNDAEVMEIKFDVNDGDVRLDRAYINFTFDGNSNADKKPWDVFDRARLLSDGEEIGDIDTSDQDEWSKESSDEYQLRFTDLDEIIREDDRADLTLELDVSDDVRGSDNGDAEWELSVDDDGIKAIDGDNDTQEIGDDSDTVNITIDNNGDDNNSNDERLQISDSDDDPDGDIDVSESSTSGWKTVFAFDMEARDNDIDVSEIPVTIEFPDGGSFDDMVSDAELEIDGDTYDSYDVSSHSSDQAILTFDTDGLEIDEDDTVTAELRIKFKKADGNYEDGDRVQASITSNDVDNIDAEGDDTLDSDQLSGSAEGQTHTLNVD